MSTGRTNRTFLVTNWGFSTECIRFFRICDHDVAIFTPGVWPHRCPTSDFNIKDEYFTLFGAVNVFYQYNITPKHSAGVTLSGVLAKYTIPAGTMS